MTHLQLLLSLASVVLVLQPWMMRMDIPRISQAPDLCIHGTIPYSFLYIGCICLNWKPLDPGKKKLETNGKKKGENYGYLHKSELGMTSSNVRNGWLPLGAMETSIPNLVDCCLESIIDLRFCGGVARSKLSPRNHLTNTEVVDELVDECATARCWSKCVGMFTVVNPKDSSRPGRSRPGLNESVKNGISKGLLQPLGCRVVTASKHHQNQRFGSYSDFSRPYCVLAWNLTSAKPVWPIFIVFISFRRPASRAHSLTFQKEKKIAQYT